MGPWWSGGRITITAATGVQACEFAADWAARAGFKVAGLRAAC
jgi:hypothetical protein